MRLAATLAAALVLASATSAAAEPHRKSRYTAKLLSGIGAGVPTALVLASFVATDPHDPYNAPMFYAGLGGALVGPSLGEFYAGEYLTWGEALRAGAVGLAIGGVQLKDTNVCLTTTDNNSCSSIEGKGVLLLSAAAILFIGGAAYDVYDAEDAVDRYNYKLRVQLMPGPMPGTMGGPPGAGVWLRGSW